MSEAFFDKKSWSRAFGPALKTLGYFSVGLLIFVLTYYSVLFLFGLIGLETVVNTIFVLLGPLILVFYFIVVIFKVLDEELINRK